MRPIKFRYRIYSITEKRVMETFYKSLDEIQNWLDILCDKKNYKILSRDESTWLLDKNGKEIYEYDVLFHEKQWKWTVIYPMNDRCAMYGIVNLDNWFVNMLQDSIFLYEIIWNIYESPELLSN